MSEMLHGDALTLLRTRFADESVHCCVTSPPYWGLRDYGVAGQLGLEKTPELYVDKMVEVFREVRRVLKDDGTLWLNLGDSYANSPKGSIVTTNSTLGGSKSYQANGTPAMLIDKSKITGLKPKDLVGIPWRVAFALQADGWYLRSDIIWSKPNPMPESVTDRPTKAHEYLFLLAKSQKYYYDAEAIAEPMSLSSEARLTQPNLANQKGSDRVPGKTNGNMKAVGKIDKKRGHGRRHAGFNDRWDAMEKAEQCSGMRNKRTVWEIATQPYAQAHFATFPPKLIEPCILAGAPAGGVVLDPFAGSGTTLMVAQQLGRQGVGIELNEQYIALALDRTRQESLAL
jgi:DNA modification methylase